MVKEAEANAADDKKKREEVDAKNDAEQTVYQAEKVCKDFEGKVNDDLIKDVRTAAESLKNDLNNADVETLKKKTEEVRQALYKLSSAAYQSGANNQQYSQENQQQQNTNTNSKKNDDGTIDAEYTEK
jgi:molecular chaperone DnaK